MVTNLTLERMEGQIKWYSEKSTWNQNWFKKLKVAEVVAAALIPFASGLHALAAFTGLLGVVVVVLESLQSIYQFQSNWITYRSTAEALRRLGGRFPLTLYLGAILLATAHAMKGARERFLAESGADDYIAKPIVSADDLIERIRALAERGAHGPAPAAR